MRTLPLLIVASLLPGCGDEAAEGLRLELRGLPATGAAGEPIAGLELVVTRDDAPAVGELVRVRADGGGVTSAELTTDEDGRAPLVWTLGNLPITNSLHLEVGELGEGGDGVRETAVVDVPVAGELATRAVGDLDAFLTDAEVVASTEDLAFDPRANGRGLVMGAGARLFTVSADGTATLIATTGEAFGRVLGLAFDADGRLYVADSEKKALMRVGVEGEVVVVADEDGGEAFESPNDVTVGPDGAVYLSDTCTGKFYALGPDGLVKDRVELDPAVDGGPNGVVVGPDGALWVTTENTGLFCGDEVGLVDPLGGLYRIPLADDGTFGPIETIARGVGVFGDGLAFDGLGNLYVIFDTVKDFALDESIVYVLPSGGRELRRAFAARGKVWANLAFGPTGGAGGYGATTMYLALLAVPPFIPEEMRGLEAVEVGVGASSGGSDVP